MRTAGDGFVGAQHAAPGKHTWRRATHSSRGCSFFVGARYIVPGANARRRAVHLRISLHRKRNEKHGSLLAIRKLRQITRHTVQSNFLRNSMKTEGRVPKEVTHFFSLAPSDFSAFRGPRR